MFGPNGILALLILGAAPSAPAEQAPATGGETRVEIRVSPEDASSPNTPAYENSTSGEQEAEAGSAYLDDSVQRVGVAMLQDVSPFDEEPSPMPPGELPTPAPPRPPDTQEMLPPDKPAAGDAERPYTEPPLGESHLEDLSDDYYPGRPEYAESASCGGECGRSPRPFWGLGLDGWISQGVTLNTDAPGNRSNYPVTFNDRSNDYQMNQFCLSLTRAVDAGGYHWDIGGRVDLLYGTDQIFTTARGLETRGDLSPKWNSQRYGLAMPQAYMEVYAPWGNGLTMKLGHFYSILGYETVPAPENFFYSKSLARQYGEPFTHTGFLGSTRLGSFNVHAGMTRGWNNWEDNNNDFGFLGGIDWTCPDQCTSIAFAIHIGREQDEPPVNTELRTVYSLVVQHWLTERLQYVLQYDHAFDEGGASGGRDADWFGVNQYLYYTIDSCWKGGIRYEWFRDEDAARIDTHAGADYFELSLGLNWTPTDWVSVRPEVRWDWADALGGRSLPAGQRDDQLLLAFDVIVRL